MTDNRGEWYDNLIKQIWEELYGEFDEEDDKGDPDTYEEYYHMLDYWSETDGLPRVYNNIDRQDWIKAAAAEWKEYKENNFDWRTP